MNRTRRKYLNRGRKKFASTDDDVLAEVDQILARHGAQGILNSGGTVRAAFDIFEKNAAATTDILLAELAKNIPHRGGKWRSAIAGVMQAVDERAKEAITIVAKKPALKQIIGNGSVKKSADELVAQMASRLRARVAEFGDGWSAPAPENWPQRHPVLFPMLLAFISFALGLLAEPIRDNLFSTAPDDSSMEQATE